MILSPEQYAENEAQITKCKEQIARFEKGPDPEDPDKQDNPIAVEALLSSYRAMLRLYEKMRNDHIRETPSEDLV